MKKFSFQLVWKSLKDAFTGFGDDKVTKLSAALAYYTGFSLAPLLVVIIAIASFFFGREAIQGSVDNHIQSFIGADAAKQIQEMIKNATVSGKGTIASIIGVVTLLIGATSIFGEIQDSINGIWGLKLKAKVGFAKTLQSRFLSFGLIASFGFLLLVSLAATALVEGLGDRLKAMLPDVTVVLFYIINLALTLGVTTVLFAIIFKVLPDAHIKWRNVLPGAVATSILFIIGKFAISLYISKSEVGSTYGAAGSLAVILVWIYYSAIILYFGAEFTKAYALNMGARIVPNHFAEWVHEPVVPGAQTKDTPKEQAEKLQPVVVPGRQNDKNKNLPLAKPVAATAVIPLTARARKHSFGMVAVGLLLYFVTSKGRQKSVKQLGAPR